MSKKTKQCLECHTANPLDAAACSACGGGSWPSRGAIQDAIPTDPELPDSEPPGSLDGEAPAAPAPRSRKGGAR